MKDETIGTMVIMLLCDTCFPGMHLKETDLPYAPAVRHIEHYVLQWETTNTVPRYEP
jgi:hypothetical protein